MEHTNKKYTWEIGDKSFSGDTMFEVIRKMRAEGYPNGCSDLDTLGVLISIYDADMEYGCCFELCGLRVSSFVSAPCPSIIDHAT